MTGRHRDGTKAEISIDPTHPTRLALQHATVEELRAFVGRVLAHAGVPKRQISRVMRCSERSARRDRSAGTHSIMDRLGPLD
ncbi:hypothetical protein P12x_003074 [Tundrisphaera lichenicola]|uniref:hypothetical protein n=1 Tax=Tundrisphaera lichenicola TaxID=2029860 RepID=UPI003EB89A41